MNVERRRSGMPLGARPPVLPLLPLLITLIALGAACGPGAPDLSPGVSWKLAEHRARRISNLRYGLRFSIPEAIDERIHSVESIRLTLSDASQPLVLDFRAAPEDVLAVYALNDQVEYEFTNGHIVIPPAVLEHGENLIRVEFLAGDMSLNRNRDFLYTLFVPDRASTAFPSLDQPNLKAVYQLTLETPASWRAVANGPLVKSDTADGRVTHIFAETRPISTYLFSFVAGQFHVESAEQAGRAMRMYHRETDSGKVARNREAIFNLHATALNWLEEYTGIPYPCDKFDFVLIPSFQYGGMEHPGAILYRASSLLLDESATQNQKLGRASLISHETTHMWFGDLVTMNWFDDVWTKEVFANFMAAKIVNPSFPEIDHDLRFFLRHYPTAYGVDRTAGANPIRQPLENLKDAGTLYGAIIYQKAPIVMQHLERLTGTEAFRQGLRQYLATFSYANATWPDLIAILDENSEEDLAAWSEVWIEEPDRPTITTELYTEGGIIRSIDLTQSDPTGGDRIWNQRLHLTLGWDDSVITIPVHLNARSVDVEGATGLSEPDFLLAAGDGLAYGLFQLDSTSRQYLLSHLPTIQGALSRGAAWVSLWDALLEGEVAPHRFIELAMTALPMEHEELNIQRILGYLTSAYWRFTSPEDRNALAPKLETLLWELLQRAGSTSLKAAYFNTYRSVALSEAGISRSLSVWSQQTKIPGLPLSERDYSALAQELALREIPNAQEVLSQQLRRIQNPDRKARFEFILPALSANPAVRDSFFASLADPRNREHEPWVLAAVAFLNHSLRAEQAVRYIRPSLELLEEIQTTGDIFFPKRWLDATLGGHTAPAAAEVVREFLSSRPEYPPRLEQKIQQSADALFRAAKILHGTK